MDITTITRSHHDYPAILNELKRPPSTLYIRGRPLSDILGRPRVAIVGSRNMTPYGERVTRQFATALAEQGIVVVSGLAIGVDAIAHQAALDAGGITMAVLPTPIACPGPPRNQYLARRIVEQGGTLLSTYSPNEQSSKYNFVQRNEYVAALSQAVLITEAAVKSGTVQTAKFAMDLGITVLSVPGNITAITSVGANQLIKTGAAITTSPDDVFHELGITATATLPKARGDTPGEQAIIDLLGQQVSDGAELLRRCNMTISELNQTLTALEISGKVRATGGNHWVLM